MFDFNTTPLAPPGTRIIIHEKPKQRASWDPHGLDAWYIGPALEHYRCINAYIPKTHAERICDTVEFFPHNIPLPTTSDAHYLKAAAEDILAILNNPKPSLSYLHRDDTFNDAIKQTASLLHRALQPPPKVQPDTIPKPKPIQNFTPTLPRVVEQQPHVIHNTTSMYQPWTNFKKLQLSHLIANKIFKPRLYHIYNEETGKQETPDSLLNGKNKDIWNKAVSMELGRLAKGNKYGVAYTETIEFICKDQVPTNRQVTYANMVFDYRPLKMEPYRCRIVAGGDKLIYDDDALSPASSLLETKLLVNSIISDAKDNARFMSADLKDFFLASPMSRPEYMKMALKYIPQDIIERYNLLELAVDGYVYIRINKGMYGLKQAEILAYQQLENFLSPAGYFPIPNTTGMWKHKTRKRSSAYVWMTLASSIIVKTTSTI